MFTVIAKAAAEEDQVPLLLSHVTHPRDHVPLPSVQSRPLEPPASPHGRLLPQPATLPPHPTHHTRPNPRVVLQGLITMAGLRGVLCFCGVLGLLAVVGEVRTHEQGYTGGGFVRTRGAEFVLDVGHPFLFNGFNSYWMMHVAADPGERQKVSDVFREAAAAGLRVCRTWAFSDGGDRALQMSPGVYDERVFQGLDFVISEARRYGIRLILSLSNNFKDFGGRQQYVQWARSAGVSINSDDDFYTNPVVKGYYKNHVKRVLTRLNTITKMVYKDDPTIMAWELMNEPRCQADYSGRTVNSWAQEMASYTKSMDSNHLLEVGMEGFYGDSMPERKQYNPGYQVGTDFISTNLIREIDFATIHAYPDRWLSGQSNGSQDSFVQRWMWSHWQDARAVLKKPLVFAEFGKSGKGHSNYTTGARNAYLDVVYGNISDLARSGGAFAGGLVWQLMAEGMESYYDGYEIVLSRDATTAGVIAGQSHLMAALSHTTSIPPTQRRRAGHEQDTSACPPPQAAWGETRPPWGRTSMQGRSSW